MEQDVLVSELKFKAVRSSGSGGQNVNKVATKVELTFNLEDSLAFSEEEKLRLFQKLSNKLTKDNNLILQCDESRSQHKNKEIVIARFLSLIQDALERKKKRIPTKIPKSVIRKRLSDKRNVSDKKTSRKKPDLD
jgi:ribosome-associated protein